MCYTNCRCHLSGSLLKLLQSHPPGTYLDAVPYVKRKLVLSIVELVRRLSAQDVDIVTSPVDLPR
jgi:hypothetical protein